MIWIIYALLSALFFSMKDIFSKNIMNQEIKPLQLLLVESFTAFTIVFIIFNKNIIFSISDIWDLYLIKAILLLISASIFLSLLKKYEVSLITPIANITPAFLIILSYFILSEKLSITNFIGIFIIVISTIFLEILLNHHHVKAPKTTFIKKISKKGVSLIFEVFIFCFFISIVAIIDKIIFIKSTNVFSNMFFTYLFIFMILTLFLTFNKELPLTIKKIYSNPKIFINGILTNISTFFILAAIAIPTAQVSLIIPLKRTSTLMSAFMGGIIFHEKHIKKKILTITAMLIGIVLIVI
ncbi:MAG: EamA family transporter [Nanobdellota archaeon]